MRKKRNAGHDNETRQRTTLHRIQELSQNINHVALFLDHSYLGMFQLFSDSVLLRSLQSNHELI